MSLISDKFRKVRLDQTPFLFHFTKGKIDDAKETLYTILNQKKLISNKNDYICFTSSPITSLHEFFKTKVNSTNLPMYQPFGIGFCRDYLIKEYGARNVIYGDDYDLSLLPQKMRWRFQKLNVDSYDFEYLREWRINGKEFDFSNIPYDKIIVIAPFLNDINDLVTEHDVEIISYFNNKTGEIEQDMEEVFKRSFKGVSIEEIKNLCNSDYDIIQIIKEQIPDEDMSDNLIKGFESYIKRKKRKE